jgi:hypothetical protein
LQAVGKLAATAGNTEAWLAAKSTAEELCLRPVGIGQENTDGGAASVRAFHVSSSERVYCSLFAKTFEVTIQETYTATIGTFRPIQLTLYF